MKFFQKVLFMALFLAIAPTYAYSIKSGLQFLKSLRQPTHQFRNKYAFRQITGRRAKRNLRKIYILA